MLLQRVPCRNMRWLHILFLMGELRSLSDLHRERLSSDRRSLQRRTPGVCVFVCTKTRVCFPPWEKQLWFEAILRVDSVAVLSIKCKKSCDSHKMLAITPLKPAVSTLTLFVWLDMQWSEAKTIKNTPLSCRLHCFCEGFVNPIYGGVCFGSVHPASLNWCMFVLRSCSMCGPSRSCA